MICSKFTYVLDLNMPNNFFNDSNIILLKIYKITKADF